MALTAYLPAKLDSEKTRFRSLQGNTQVDYRSDTGSAPYLLGTPYIFSDNYSVNLDIASPKVPAETHITGDSGNYRRFSSDILLVSDDYQRNLFILFTDTIQISAEYDHSYYVKRDANESGGTVKHEERHVFKVTNTNRGKKILSEYTAALYNIKPLLIDITEKEMGFVDTSNVLVLKRKSVYTDATFYYSEDGLIYTEDGYTGNATITITTISSKATVVDNATIPVSEVPEDIRSFDLFTAGFTPDAEYFANLIYVSSFNKNGMIFSTENNQVLNDAYTNYYLYSKFKGVDQDIIGYSVNISPSTGAFLHAVLGTDEKEYSISDDLVIGRSSFLYKTIYTGLLGSPYVMLKFYIDTSDTFSLKVNNTTHSLGSFSKETFFDLYKKLDSILEPLGFILICFENEHISIDRKTNSTTDIEISIESAKTSIETVNTFSDMAVLEDPTVLLSSGLESHPKNSSFTYIEPGITEDATGNQIPDRESLLFKFVLTPNGTRPFNFGTETITLDVNSIKGRTLMVTINLGSKSINGELSFEESDTATQIVDKIFKLLTDNVTSTRYTFTKDYSNATITVLDKYSSNMDFDITLDIIDEEPPVLVSAQVDTNGIIYLTYNEKLKVGALDARTFTVIADNVGLEVKSSEVFAGDETRIKVTTFPQIGDDQVVSIAYTGTVIKDTIGNLAVPFNTATDAINVVNNSSNIPTTDMDVLSINPYTIPYGNDQEIVPLVYNSVTDTYSIDYDNDFIAKTDGYLKFVHQFNKVLRVYGYEATPLFLDESKTTLSPNIGIMKIAENNNLFIGTYKDDELRLGSAKGLYIPYTTAKLVSKNNFTIESYTNFPENTAARLYKLGSQENTVYSSGRSIEGTIALRDNFVIGFKHSDYYGGHSGSHTLNFISNQYEAYDYLLWTLVTGESSWSSIHSSEWVVDGDNISCPFFNNTSSFTINTTTGNFKIQLDSRYTGLACLLKLTNESDLTITKGGIFTSAPDWMTEMTTTPGSVNKLFLSFYNQNIDGDGL